MTDIHTGEPWLGQWQKVRPDIDPAKFAINGRLIRLLRSFERHREKLLESIGLTLETSDLLISLLRSGAPEGLSVTELRSADLPHRHLQCHDVPNRSRAIDGTRRAP